jgi:hypothetical protein
MDFQQEKRSSWSEYVLNLTKGADLFFRQLASSAKLELGSPERIAKQQSSVH